MPPKNSDTPKVAPTLHLQIATLFGESLFGPWRNPDDYLGFTHTRERRGLSVVKIGVLLLILAILIAGGWVVWTGLHRRSIEKRSQVARNLATFLREGELDGMQQFLSLLHNADSPLTANDPHLDLILRSEAVLFRYHDADPVRINRMRPHLSETASASKILARLTILSQQERATHLAELEAIEPVFYRDPEFHYLLATVFESKGAVTAARSAWDRSLELGPLWLPHRYEQIDFEVRQRNHEVATKLLWNLVRVAPDAAWTRFAFERFGSLLIPKSNFFHAGANVQQTPSVSLFHHHFALALAKAQVNDRVLAWRDLTWAVRAIHGQAPFVLDAFDWLYRAKAFGLARELTGFEAWPRHSIPATARLIALTESELHLEHQPLATTKAPPNSKRPLKKSTRSKAKRRSRR